jgi:8-oxo-dGTP pyrophosphatase MutT (NUDIX family)
MSYEKDHRSHMLKTGFWGRRAAGCIFLARATGRLCFALRSRHALDPHTYGTWGGAIDGDEVPVSAVLREVREETGLTTVNEAHLTPLFVFRKDGVFEYHNFLVTLDDEFAPILNWENEAFVWAALGDWPDPLHFGAVSLLEDPRSMQIIREHAGSAL